MSMMNEVTKMFKSHPEMINKVSKCVNNIMDNKDIMETLISKVNMDLNESSDQSDQTLLNNTLAEQLAAISKESTQ